MAQHNEFGHAAEALARGLLSGAGWTILERNWRWHRREIDIVARRGAVVAFVEVRARRSAGHGHPFETIGWRKRRWLEEAARAWIARFGRPADTYRFDAIAICAPRGDLRHATTEHVEGAWTLSR